MVLRQTLLARRARRLAHDVGRGGRAPTDPTVRRASVSAKVLHIQHRRRWIVLPATLALLVAAPAAYANGGPSKEDSGLRLTVLSGRADTVSGGDALVQLAGARSDDARIRLNGRDVTREFAVRSDGRVLGLVTGLRVGRNQLVASTGHIRHHTARLTLTNHPIGGPIFAGPQVQPWDCTPHSDMTGLGAPTDAQCDTAPTFRFAYMPASHTGFRPYDPAHPASDVATTTTDAGVTVPYIVRVETGVEDRGIYQIAVLFDPAQGWTPFAVQRGWNRKVVWPFGGGSAPHHTSDLPTNVLDDTTLSRGYLVANSGLNVHGSDANENVSAEAVTMLKEHVIEMYGEIRYTIGAGCSGGSIQQYSIAEEYPGLLDGILPNCSYPDLWTTSTEVTDCGLLVRFFAANPGWTPAQQAAVAGTKDTTVCQFWNATFVPVGIPSIATNCGFAAGDPRVYNPATNPGGVRCDIADYQQAIWGPRPRSEWTAPERAIGHGFGASPADNTGVLYGLGALRSGAITPAQFTDLNAGIGGYTVDSAWQADRTTADPGTLSTAYRSGQVTQALRLNDVPIIDLRGSANVNDIHTDYHSWEMRARLDAAHGSHANQVIWTWNSFGSFVGITPPPDITVKALSTMDSWLAALAADHRNLPRSVKVRLDKPAAAVDACWPSSTVTAGGPEVVDPGYAGVCGTTFPHFGDARTVAGEGPTGLALKCAAQPLHRSMLPQLSDAQFARVRAALPGGVCDWSRRPVGFQPSLPWLSFASGPGGKPLG
jgi:hypothetical protein